MNWLDGMRAIQEEGQGIASFVVILPEEIPGIISAAAEGNPGAMDRAQAVLGTAKRFATAPRREPLLCVSCPRRLKRGCFAIVLVTPERPDRKNGMCFAICERCGETRGQVTARAHTVLKKIWPDSRQIEIPLHSSAGRA